MWSLLAVELLVSTVILIEISQSLKCYQCRSDIHDGCDSDVNASWSIDCKSDNSSTSTNKSSAYCRKIKQKLKFYYEKDWTSIRECAYEKQGKGGCYKFKWMELAYQEVCECTGDNCNRGRSQGPTWMTVALIAFAWIFSYLKTNIT